jgi:hypothetical protein
LGVVWIELWEHKASRLSVFLYMYKSESGWLAGRVCVHVARRRWAVAMQWGHFLWGPFWIHYLAHNLLYKPALTEDSVYIRI